MHQSNPAWHAEHDLDLIASHAAGDLSDTERHRADELLRSCTSCAALRRDLVAIASATRALPPIASASHDFRLEPAQAARLRRGGLLRGLLGPFAAPRSVVRPFAAAFTTLGLAGLLVASILPGLAGGFAAGSASGPGAAPANRDLTVLSRPGATAAAEQNPVAAPVASGDSAFGAFGAGPSAAPDRLEAKDGTASTPPAVAVGGGSGGPDQPDQRNESAGLSSSPFNPLLVGSVALLVVGLALFGLRFVARRVR